MDATESTDNVHARGAGLAPGGRIALAAILLFGYRFWPGVALGAVRFSFMNGMPFGFFTLGTVIGNTVGAIVCAFLLEKFIAFDNAMEHVEQLIFKPSKNVLIFPS